MGKSRRMYGSERIAMYRPISSVFHEGFSGVGTGEPSERCIFVGDTKNMGSTTPIHVRTRNPIWSRHERRSAIVAEKLTYICAIANGRRL